MTVEAASSVVRAAVDRALTKQREEATREVEAILDAALRVAERVAPEAPRVAAIVAEAGTSNQAFYRYFAGKDDLMRAVMQRGIVRVRGYIEHQTAKESEPLKQIEAWIRGVLTQVTARAAARQSVAVNLQISPQAGDVRAGLPDLLRQLLIEPLTRAGSTEIERDADAVGEAVYGTMNRHLWLGTAPTGPECDHLVRFCLRGLSIAGDSNPARPL
jgi:AcrR family transcriptional regulator